MRYIANYFRQVFCKHRWAIEEVHHELNGPIIKRSGIKIFMHCRKCEYHKSYWKV